MKYVITTHQPNSRELNWVSLSWEFYKPTSFDWVEKYFQSNLTSPMHKLFFYEEESQFTTHNTPKRLKQPLGTRM